MGRVKRASDSTTEMVHELLKTEADLDGIVNASFVYVAEKLGISVETVGLAIDNLERVGSVEHVSRCRHNINVFQLIDF